MGDQGRLYVAEDIVPAYQGLIGEADLILPNQFEAEILSGVKIGDLGGVAEAVRVIHQRCGTRHVVVTSLTVGDTGEGKSESGGKLTVVGSSRTQDGSARLFKIDVPKLDVYFSGTGDMFAALMVARLREACSQAGVLERASWMSDDDVESVELPLARATEKVLSSMQMVLEKTIQARDEELKKLGWGSGGLVDGEGKGENGDESKRRYLAETKAAEVRVVRNVRALVAPVERYKAQALEG